MTEKPIEQDYFVLGQLVKETLVGKKEYSIEGVNSDSYSNRSEWVAWKFAEKALAKTKIYGDGFYKNNTCCSTLLKVQSIKCKDLERVVVLARLAEGESSDERRQKKIDIAVKKLTALKVQNPRIDGLIEIREELKKK